MILMWNNGETVPSPVLLNANVKIKFLTL